MADLPQVTLAPEPWSAEFAPVLAVLKWPPAYVAATVAAIERGEAVMMAARRDGEALGALVLKIENWPRRSVCVVAMAVKRRSGFNWGKAFLPGFVALVREAGHDVVSAVARTPGNARRLRALGFREAATLMECAA